MNEKAVQLERKMPNSRVFLGELDAWLAERRESLRDIRTGNCEEKWNAARVSTMHGRGTAPIGQQIPGKHKALAYSAESNHKRKEVLASDVLWLQCRESQDVATRRCNDLAKDERTPAATSKLKKVSSLKVRAEWRERKECMDSARHGAACQGEKRLRGM